MSLRFHLPWRTCHAGPGHTLTRAIAYLTTDLDAPAAARFQATVMRSPALAARCGYALGYLEGNADQAIVADATANVPDDEHLLAKLQEGLEHGSPTDGQAR